MFPALRAQVAAWLEDGTIHAPLSVVEIGGLDVNGGVRDLFACPYTTVDRQDGAGVDVVQDGAEYLAYRCNLGDAPHTVVCLEALEHDRGAMRTAAAIGFACKQFILSVPSFDGAGTMPHHDYGGDYWRFSEQAVRKVLMRGFNVIALARVHDTVGHESIIAVGRRTWR